MEIALYCPRCADRIHRHALALAFEEVVACASCAARVKAKHLLTEEGKTLLDYLALLSVRVASRGPRSP